MKRRPFIGVAAMLAVAGCMASPPDEANNDDSGPDPVESFKPPDQDGSFPGHRTMATGEPVEIRTRSEFIAVLEANGVPVRDTEHRPGTPMTLHIEISEAPESFRDVAYPLALISKAYWAWMLFEGELRPPDEWGPEDIDGEDDERYPPLLIEVNMYADTDDGRAAGFTITDEYLVEYVTGERSAAEYEAAVRESSKEP